MFCNIFLTISNTCHHRMISTEWQQNAQTSSKSTMFWTRCAWTITLLLSCLLFIVILRLWTCCCNVMLSLIVNESVHGLLCAFCAAPNGVEWRCRVCDEGYDWETLSSSSCWCSGIYLWDCRSFSLAKLRNCRTDVWIGYLKIYLFVLRGCPSQYVHELL